MATDPSASTARIHSVRRLSDHDLATNLAQLNAQKSALDAELILYLSELERRRLYRQFACPSLFDFCVTRLGYSEDVAYKRVGIARMLQQFPSILEPLTNGRIHLTGLMLIKPHLTDANHQEWLLAASGKTKRQIEKLIASRHPQPDVPTSVRKLPEARTHAQSGTVQSLVAVQPCAPETLRTTQSVSSQSVASQSVASQSVASQSVASQSVASQSVASQSVASQSVASQSVSSQSVASQSVSSQSVSSQSVASQSVASQSVMSERHEAHTAEGNGATTRIVPLSGHSYRVVFTASEGLKRKLDRARELLSHAIPSNDLPAIIERALDQLIMREEQRRYATHPRPAASKGSTGTAAAAAAGMIVDQPEAPPGDLHRGVTPIGESSERNVSQREAPRCEAPEPHASKLGVHAACQKVPQGPTRAQDPDPNPSPHLAAKQRSRYVPAAVRREVFTRDGGQCTFVDHSGRRCEQRLFLEFDHCEAFAIGGDATVDNLRIRCKSHNALEAEKLFGQNKVASAIACAKRGRPHKRTPRSAK